MSCVTVSLVLDTSPYSTSPMMPNRWSTSTPRPMSTLAAASTRTAAELSTSSRTAATAANASIAVVGSVKYRHRVTTALSCGVMMPSVVRSVFRYWPRSATRGIDGAVHRVRSYCIIRRGGGLYNNTIYNKNDVSYYVLGLRAGKRENVGTNSVDSKCVRTRAH